MYQDKALKENKKYNYVTHESFRGNTLNMRTMEYKIGFIKSTFEWRAESFLFNLGKSTKRCDDFVAFSIQFTTEDNVVIGVRQQMLDHQNEFELFFSNVFPVIILATLLPKFPKERNKK